VRSGLKLQQEHLSSFRVSWNGWLSFDFLSFAFFSKILNTSTVQYWSRTRAIMNVSVIIPPRTPSYFPSLHVSVFWAYPVTHNTSEIGATKKPHC
jgi:hypothetical protein